jgi:ABC-type Fe3+-hydroxamate transport system substrate-binding protein
VIVDDEGGAVAAPDQVRRVVSLVPSLTEAVAASASGLLVGATDWCTHPADLDVARVKGTKYPDVPAILALAPDLVVANQEENRRTDLDALRSAGVAVYVTDIRTLDDAFGSLARMLAACGLARPAWLDEAERAWAAVPEPRTRTRAVVPIWRKPWMAVGRDTFTGAVLARLGVDNVLCDDPDRYPRFTPETLPPHDLVVLPDEPYNFTAEDGPEAFPGSRSVLVSGRLLTWYGPSLTEAARVLPAQLAAPGPVAASPTTDVEHPED